MKWPFVKIFKRCSRDEMAYLVENGKCIYLKSILCSRGRPAIVILFPLNSVSREHSRRKTNVYLKSPHLNLASKDFKEAKQSNCFSADSLPVESAQCLRLGDPQTEFKMSTKPLLKFYCALSTGKESAETELLNWLL